MNAQAFLASRFLSRALRAASEERQPWRLPAKARRSPSSIAASRCLRLPRRRLAI